MLNISCDWNHIHLAFAKAQRGLDCLDQTPAIFFSDSDAILNDLHTHAEPLGFWIGFVHSHDLIVDPNPQVSLLLQEIEEPSRLRFRRDRNSERDDNILADAVAQNLLRD